MIELIRLLAIFRANVVFYSVEYSEISAHSCIRTIGFVFLIVLYLKNVFNVSYVRTCFVSVRVTFPKHFCFVLSCKNVSLLLF